MGRKLLYAKQFGRRMSFLLFILLSLDFPLFLFFWAYVLHRPGGLGAHCLSQFCLARFNRPDDWGNLPATVEGALSVRERRVSQTCLIQLGCLASFWKPPGPVSVLTNGLPACSDHTALRGGSAPVVEHQGQGEGKTCVFREYPVWFVGSRCTRRVRPRVTYLGF